MPVIDDVPYCDGCGVEIRGAPVVKGKEIYCCQDCADGYECACALEAEEG